MLDTKYKILNTFNRGFTLVETLVAISVLAISITGPMIIAQKGIGSSVYARDEITAFYLAQEAVEYIRSIRDSNRTNGAVNWLTDFSPCISPSTCTIDSTITSYATSTAIVACGGTCNNLKFNSTYHLYGHNGAVGWNNTIFKRTVSMTELVSGREAVVSVTVAWSSTLFASVRTFTIKEHLFNF